MDHNIKLCRVFIASPSDVGEERKALKEVVERINSIYSKETDWRIELLGWEDTMPGCGRPQALINADLDKADLFIGCLWKRWGSIAGEDGKSGFEEEFTRALARSAGSGLPTMWQFFKKVDRLTLSDPGQQLQRVLAFREQQVQEKRLLFKEFTETSEWKEIVSDLLERHMLKLVISRPTQAKEAQGTGIPQSNSPSGDSSEESKNTQKVRSPTAFTALATVLKQAEQRVHGKKLAVLDRSEALPPHDTIRLLLFSAANYDWNAQHIQLGTHEINSAYLQRQNLDLTVLEHLFLLRTVLFDDSLSKPGWFWLKEWKLNISTWLPWFVVHDSEGAMRVRAIDLATRIAFPLYKRTKRLDPPIYVALKDQQASVRSAALVHLAKHGRAVDLEAVERLLTDDDNDVRSQAERTARLVRLRIDPDGETRRSIEQRDPFDDGIADATILIAHGLSQTTLEMALAHTNEVLKTVAARELLKRGKVLSHVATQMCTSEVLAVRECGFLARIRNHENVDPLQIRSSLCEPFMSFAFNAAWWNRVDADSVIITLLSSLSLEELFSRVYSFNDDSPLALKALGKQHLTECATRIRGDLEDDFSARMNSAKAYNPEIGRLPDLSPLISRLLGNPVSNLETTRKSIRIAALELLAGRRDPCDRDCFLRYLTTAAGDPNQIAPCLLGLAHVGAPKDRESVAPFLSDSNVLVEALATRAYLALSPNKVVSVKDLLNKPSENKVWVLVRYALKHSKPELWPMFAPLLGHESERIRRLTCYYADCTLSRQAITALLRDYLKRSQYFYNVVALLDRSIYSPPSFREMYSKEETEFVEALKPGSKWEWDE
jgi:hypothetical protein